jgi:hypothetical protein
MIKTSYKMQAITQTILQSTQEMCTTLIPLMESSTNPITYTNSIQIGEYTFTITMNKKPYIPQRTLGKRHHIEEEIPITRRPFYHSDQLAEFEPFPHSDHVLYNNFGHNFSHTNPQPFISENNISYIS